MRDGDSTAMSSIEEYNSISRIDCRVVDLLVVDEVGIEIIEDGPASGGFIEEKFYVGVGYVKPLSEEALDGSSVIDAAG